MCFPEFDRKYPPHTSLFLEPLAGFSCLPIQVTNCRRLAGLLWRSSSLDLPFNAGGAGSIPGWGPKIPHAPQLKNQSIF